MAPTPGKNWFIRNPGGTTTGGTKTSPPGMGTGKTWAGCPCPQTATEVRNKKVRQPNNVRRIIVPPSFLAARQLSWLVVIPFQVEEYTVLFVTDHRVKVASRIGAFRLKCKTPVVRFSRPVNRCSRLHKLTPETLQEVDHFLPIRNPTPLDVKRYLGGHGCERWNVQGRVTSAVGEIVEQIVRVRHGNVAQSERCHTRAKVNFY